MEHREFVKKQFSSGEYTHKRLEHQVGVQKERRNKLVEAKRIKLDLSLQSSSLTTYYRLGLALNTTQENIKKLVAKIRVGAL